ncbi:hypothetical protein [Rugosimonospora africana]|uniref:Uncharacterized protein n=1 Tax=Rugosimonospora africana TaxID=556532 RepID=A0A8J3QXQ5_9ACTN|nr:hypothetical protein [Rugosimonospora africana]GIH19335.1 hypothetical protein Raf01_75070 [Rugosimonospora africana]
MRPDAPADSPSTTLDSPPAQPGYESWSTQPPRYGDRHRLRSLLVAAACVVLLVAVGVVLAVRLGTKQPATPDTRPLLVPVPAGALACAQNNTLISGNRLAHSDGVPAALGSTLSGSGLLSMAYRCWLPIIGSEVDVILLRFDTAEHAQGMVLGDQKALGGTAAISEVPSVPGALNFRLRAQPARLWVLGARHATAFAILATTGQEFDADAIDEIAAQQYARL